MARLSLTSNFLRGLCLASSVFCFVVLFLDGKTRSTCFVDSEGDTKYLWGVVMAFAAGITLLLGVMMKRITIAQMGQYNVVGLLQNFHELEEKPMEYALRVYGVLLHVCCLVTSLIFLGEVANDNCLKGLTTLQWSVWIAFGCFWALFLCEVYLGCKSNNQVSPGTAPIVTAEKPSSPIAAHIASSLVLFGIVVCAIYRFDHSESLYADGVKYGLMTRLSVCVQIFLSVVAFTMLAGDYLIEPDLKHTTLAATHGRAYVLCVVIWCLTLLDYMLKDDFTDQYGKAAMESRIKDWVTAQIVLATLLLGLGPLIGWGCRKVTGDVKGKTAVTFENHNLLRPSSDTFSNSRLVKTNRDTSDAVNLQFV